MFVEERLYTLYPGKLSEYLKHYTEEGMAIQTRHLPAMVGYYTSEAGASKELIYDLVPGRFDPDIPVTAATRAMENGGFETMRVRAGR